MRVRPGLAVVVSDKNKPDAIAWLNALMGTSEVPMVIYLLARTPVLVLEPELHEHVVVLLSDGQIAVMVADNLEYLDGNLE